MKINNIDVQKLRDQISKGLDLTFQKLIKQKKGSKWSLSLI